MSEIRDEHRWDRKHLTLKDWIQILLLAGGLLANYVAIDRRITVLETKMDFVYRSPAK